MNHKLCTCVNVWTALQWAPTKSCTLSFPRFKLTRLPGAPTCHALDHQSTHTYVYYTGPTQYKVSWVLTLLWRVGLHHIAVDPRLFSYNGTRPWPNKGDSQIGSIINVSCYPLLVQTIVLWPLQLQMVKFRHLHAHWAFTEIKAR